MSHVRSSLIQTGTPAPNFILPDASGTNWTFDECTGATGTAVVFACNHCPFVNHIASALGRLEVDLREQGVGIVAIASSDLSLYPEDGPEHFAENATEWDWHFPYLWDQTQRVTRSRGAAARIARDHRVAYRRHRGAKPVKPLLVEDIVS